jgi:hypothetical protein
MIPTGTARPIRPELVTIIGLNHDYSNGQRWQLVTVYEDDHDAKARRVLDLRLPMTPSGKIKRAAELEAKVSHCDGYDAERHQWGADGYRTAYHSITHAEAAQVLAYAHQAAESDQFKPGPHNTRAFATYYRKP